MKRNTKLADNGHDILVKNNQPTDAIKKQSFYGLSLSEISFRKGMFLTPPQLLAILQKSAQGKPFKRQTDVQKLVDICIAHKVIANFQLLQNDPFLNMRKVFIHFTQKPFRFDRLRIQLTKYYQIADNQIQGAIDDFINTNADKLTDDDFRALKEQLQKLCFSRIPENKIPSQEWKQVCILEVLRDYFQKQASIERYFYKPYAFKELLKIMDVSIIPLLIRKKLIENMQMKETIERKSKQQEMVKLKLPDNWKDQLDQFLNPSEQMQVKTQEIPLSLDKKENYLIWDEQSESDDQEDEFLGHFK